MATTAMDYEAVGGDRYDGKLSWPPSSPPFFSRVNTFALVIANLERVPTPFQTSLLVMSVTIEAPLLVLFAMTTTASAVVLILLTVTLMRKFLRPWPTDMIDQAPANPLFLHIQASQGLVGLQGRR